MDKLKGTSETAGAAMRMPTSEDMAYAQRAQRLHQVGVEAPAVLNALELAGQMGAWATPGGAIRVKIDPDDPSAMLWMGAG